MLIYVSQLSYTILRLVSAQELCFLKRDIEELNMCLVADAMCHSQSSFIMQVEDTVRQGGGRRPVTEENVLEFPICFILSSFFH